MKLSIVFHRHWHVTKPRTRKVIRLIWISLVTTVEPHEGRVRSITAVHVVDDVNIQEQVFGAIRRGWCLVHFLEDSFGRFLAVIVFQELAAMVIWTSMLFPR